MPLLDATESNSSAQVLADAHSAIIIALVFSLPPEKLDTFYKVFNAFKVVFFIFYLTFLIIFGGRIALKNLVCHYQKTLVIFSVLYSSL